jgi:hypothetical protein
MEFAIRQIPSKKNRETLVRIYLRLKFFAIQRHILNAFEVEIRT